MCSLVFLGLNLLPSVDCLSLPCAFPSHLLALVSQQMENPSEANLVSNFETVCASSDLVNPSGQLSVPGVADPIMEQFLVAQTHFMSVMMQNMNNMMTQQNQTTVTSINLMNQNNQANRRTTTSVSTRADANQQLSPVPVVTHQNPSQFPATQNQLMPATISTSCAAY